MVLKIKNKKGREGLEGNIYIFYYYFLCLQSWMWLILSLCCKNCFRKLSHVHANYVFMLYVFYCYGNSTIINQTILVIVSEKFHILLYFPLFSFMYVVWYYTPECIWTDSHRRQTWVSTSATLGIKSFSVCRFWTKCTRWECR